MTCRSGPHRWPCGPVSPEHAARDPSACACGCRIINRGIGDYKVWCMMPGEDSPLLHLSQRSLAAANMFSYMISQGRRHHSDFAGMWFYANGHIPNSDANAWFYAFNQGLLGQPLPSLCKNAETILRKIGWTLDDMCQAYILGQAWRNRYPLY